jgi:type I restriction-modification system DNA methylase subunit
MTNETFNDIEKLESDLWEAADNLRANSKLTSSDYFMPVLGVIFLRHAANRFEAADWSLTPGRYVGVAPPEEDEDFDSEQAIRDIYTELADLNKEAMELAAKIQENFEELGI